MQSAFEIWVNQVELYLIRAHKLTTGDLDDMPYATWFERGVSAKAAAKRAIKWTMRGYRPDYAD